MMRWLLAITTVATLVTAAAHAQDAPSAADKAAVQQVISAQIEAFRHEDGAAALAFAAPNIRAKFNDGPHFLAMVHIGYQPVLNPRSISFGTLSRQDADLAQEVELTGPSGESSLAIYTMEHEADGSWKIAGCALAKSKRLDI